MPAAPHVKLLVLPCAGASATMYLRWRRWLPAWVQLLPVELPGRGGRLDEPCVEDYERLVAQLCDEHAGTMRGDYVLFGHSMGAMLAHGIARRQRELGRPAPSLLFASGSPAPSQHDPKRFEGKDDDASLIADMRKQGGTPEEVYACEELMRLTLDTLRADYRACASFRYGAPASLPFPLHVFAGSDDDIAGQRIEAWRQEAAGAFSLDWFDGGHFFVRQREPEVLAALMRHLARRFCAAPGEPARAA